MTDRQPLVSEVRPKFTQNPTISRDTEANIRLNNLPLKPKISQPVSTGGKDNPQHHTSTDHSHQSQLHMAITDLRCLLRDSHISGDKSVAMLISDIQACVSDIGMPSSSQVDGIACRIKACIVSTMMHATPPDTNHLMAIVQLYYLFMLIVKLRIYGGEIRGQLKYQIASLIDDSEHKYQPTFKFDPSSIQLHTTYRSDAITREGRCLPATQVRRRQQRQR